MAVYATLAAPSSVADVQRIAAATAALGNPDLALDIAGVVFAFNTVNRVADARRVRLEYHWLREMKPIQGWVERRFSNLTRLIYDLSYAHRPRHAPEELLRRLRVLVQRRGASGVPDYFLTLQVVPQVFEGIFEMLNVNARDATVRSHLWLEAAAIATASLATAGSGLRQMVDQWLDQESLPDSGMLLTLASSDDRDPGLVATCRRYAWKVSNAAYTITHEEIRRLCILGLSDAEVLDLTLAGSLFSALAVVEPLIGALTPDQGRLLAR